MENPSGLLVDARLTRVSGHAERLAALEIIEPHADRPRAITLGADRGYDAADFVEELRTLNVRPHVAQNVSGRRSAFDRRTTRHASYAASLRIRKRIEEAFGWIKMAETFDIRAIEVTSNTVGDGQTLPDLLAQIPEDETIVAVGGDGAYDTRGCHATIDARGADPVIPVRRNGKAWTEGGPGVEARNETLRAMKRLDRTIWKKWSGYVNRYWSPAGSCPAGLFCIACPSAAAAFPQ